MGEEQAGCQGTDVAMPWMGGKVPPAVSRFLPARFRDLLADEAKSRQLFEFARFVVVGIGNTLFGYAIFALLLLTLGDHRMALAIATVIGVLFNFLTTGGIVFGSRQIHRLPFFIVGYAVCFVINLWALDYLNHGGVPAIWGQLILLPVMVVLSFCINKFIVFRGIR
ncbi:GtrA family protein [Nitrospirillum iridis]|uniref:Putative flippase GtrA n=1 Tax=Nitrospirillum iridis TaxID=765888 RepID=A0A7X0EDN0_9PROT|nr:GtrA family protein [Nitrospirillum iridis]MBB6252928.1 putative flippase GtrA [Nitrospirillum iridis]